MPFKPGQKKTPGSGRQKGQLNRDTRTLREKAHALGVDPFEILLKFAKEDWKGLGYDARTKISYTSAGIEFEEFHIPPALRQKSAAEAVQYLEPKRKALDVTYDAGDLDKLKEMKEKTTEELLAIVASFGKSKITSTEK